MTSLVLPIVIILELSGIGGKDFTYSSFTPDIQLHDRYVTSVNIHSVDQFLVSVIIVLCTAMSVSGWVYACVFVC